MFKSIPSLIRYGKVLLPKRQLQNVNQFSRRTLVAKAENSTQAINRDDEAEDTVKSYTNPFAKPVQRTIEESFSQESPEERQRRLKVLQLEVDIARQEGKRVPTLNFVTDAYWENILSLPTKSSRFKYYTYLWQVEVKRNAKERKKIERAEATLKRKEELRKEREENTHIIYGLGHTSLFLRIYDSTINHWQNNRLTRAMQFSPKLVIDCSYDQHMNHREATNAAKQLMLTFADNRAHDDPFDLHYCNVNMNSTCMRNLKKFIPTMLNPEFPMNVHEKCFTEIFPKENLVYLTPHCRNDLVGYNPDDVYIVGAMVDTMNNEPLSLAKAKKLGIRMARLPLDTYLQWGAGSGKSLTINQMINIMLDIKKTGDWDKSLAHVPRRKIVDSQLSESREREKLQKRANKFNVRITSILDDEEDELNSHTNGKNPNVRSYKNKLEFNLDTWGNSSNKNKKNDP